MKLRIDQLKPHLNKPLSPIYLVYGDESLFVQEACALIRQAARQQGFSERKVFHADSQFQWLQLGQCAASYSLFSDKTLIELRLASGKPGDKGSKQIQAYCADPADDKVLLIQCGKLESASQRSKWVKAVTAAGVVIQVWPLQTKDLPRWIQQRASKRGLRLSPQAIAVICDRVEGNLLAAKQEIEKLYMLYGDRTVDEDEVIQAVAESARYNMFQLVDEALAGKLNRCARIIDGLSQEGVEPILILWAIVRDIRTLTQAAREIESGVSVDEAINSLSVWPKRRPLYKNALKRQSLPSFHLMLHRAGQIDKMIKGMIKGQVWDELLQLVAQLASGRPLLAKIKMLDSDLIV